jgi:hypothetical protein
VVDERRKPVRAPTFGDRNESRRRTPPAGSPVHIDPEITPPPQEPPRPETLRGFELIDEAVQVQLANLATGLGQVTEALGKVWDARKDADKLTRIDEKLGTLAGYATEHHTLLHQQVWPAVKELMKATDELSRQLPALLVQVETMAGLVGDVDRRLRNLERDMGIQAERFASHRQELEARVRASEATGNSHDVRLTAMANRIAALELLNRDENVAIEAVSASDKRRIALIRTAVVIGSGVIGFIVAKGGVILDFLTR